MAFCNEILYLIRYCYWTVRVRHAMWQIAFEEAALDLTYKNLMLK